MSSTSQTPSPKKPLWKRKWVWAVAAAVLIGGIASNASSQEAEDQAVEQPSVVQATDTPEPDPTPAPSTSTSASAPTSTAAPAPSTSVAPPPPPAPRTTVAPPPPPKPQVSSGQQQALRQAKQYLDFSAFSRQGLIDQLSSPYGGQFSVADATYAADNAGADWFAEAEEAAKDYLNFTAFSRQGLIDQLTSQYGSQFTQAEAEYGVTQAGL